MSHLSLVKTQAFGNDFKMAASLSGARLEVLAELRGARLDVLAEVLSKPIELSVERVLSHG